MWEKRESCQVRSPQHHHYHRSRPTTSTPEQFKHQRKTGPGNVVNHHVGRALSQLGHYRIFSGKYQVGAQCCNLRHLGEAANRDHKRTATFGKLHRGRAHATRRTRHHNAIPLHYFCAVQHVFCSTEDTRHCAKLCIAPVAVHRKDVGRRHFDKLSKCPVEVRTQPNVIHRGKPFRSHAWPHQHAQPH